MSKFCLVTKMEKKGSHGEIFRFSDGHDLIDLLGIRFAEGLFSPNCISPKW